MSIHCMSTKDTKDAKIELMHVARCALEVQDHLVHYCIDRAINAPPSSRFCVKLLYYLIYNQCKINLKLLYYLIYNQCKINYSQYAANL